MDSGALPLGQWNEDLADLESGAGLDILVADGGVVAGRAALDATTRGSPRRRHRASPPRGEGRRGDDEALSREQAVSRPAPGVVSGGKYTAHRAMARDAIDAAWQERGDEGFVPPRSPTAPRPLDGDDGCARAREGRRALAAELDATGGNDVERLLSAFSAGTARP